MYHNRVAWTFIICIPLMTFIAHLSAGTIMPNHTFDELMSVNMVGLWVASIILRNYQ